MFNYLLYTLKRDGIVMTTPKLQQSMQYLLLYVYDYNNDPFSLSMRLLKKGYLNYYFSQNLEPDFLDEGEEIVTGLKKIIKMFRGSRDYLSQH